MNDQLLAAVSQYGAPALFGIVAIAAIGVPLPITLLLIVAGSMISQGAMNLWWTIGAAGAGSILGDQAGYAIGRWGGPAVVIKLSGMFGKRVSMQAMEAKVKAWAALAYLLPAGCSVPWDPGSTWPAVRPATRGIDSSSGTFWVKSPGRSSLSLWGGSSAIA